MDSFKHAGRLAIAVFYLAIVPLAALTSVTSRTSLLATKAKPHRGDIIERVIKKKHKQEPNEEIHDGDDSGNKWLSKAVTLPASEDFLKEPMTEGGDRAKEAVLDEAGYLSVVKLENNEQMEVYIRRLIVSLGLRVRDEGGLQGMLPQYSGERAIQNFFSLKLEILAASALENNSWLTEDPAISNSTSLSKIKTLSGDTAPLNERGYWAVVKLGKFKEMAEFIRRTIASLGLFIAQEGPFHGMVPYYSGELGKQSFAQMRKEIMGAVRVSEGWVASGDSVVLSEAGYRSVAALKNDEQMGIFTTRVAEHFGCSVVDEGGLAGIVPHFSGTISVQTLALLSQEVRRACDLKSAADEIRYGSIHDVVGKDGVLQISLDSSTRYKYSQEELRSANIVPTQFSATDAHTANPDVLRESCPLASEPNTKFTCKRQEEVIGTDLGFSEDPGCKSKVEQAITDSHRRALTAALTRESDWTAIIEDDVVPLHPGYFNASFKKAWMKVPRDAKMVRLSWCSFEQDLGSIAKRTYADAGEFRLVKSMYWNDQSGNAHYYAGGCTTGYIVHRDIIPELLNMFPCCCPIDCCMERQLFYAPTMPERIYGFYRGQQIMINMDAWDSREDSLNYTSFTQGGVFVQDNRDLASLRPLWNSTDIDE